MIPAVLDQCDLVFATGCPSGKLLPITGTNTATANEVHTPPAGLNAVDFLYLVAHNISAAAVLLTIEWGGVTAGDQIQVTVPARGVAVPVVYGLPIQAGLPVRAFAATGNVINVHAYVQRYSRAA